MQEQPPNESSQLGLVIRTLPFSESSQIASVLTNTGIIDLMCKGIGRKNSQLRGPLDNWLMVEFHAKSRKAEGSLSDLRSCRHLAWFPKLRSSLSRWYAAELIREVMLRAPLPPEDGENMLRLAHASLRHLEAGKRPSIDVIVEFFAKWLELHGLQPELEHCVRTGLRATGKATVFFSYHDFGLISETIAGEVEGKDFEALPPKALRLLWRVFGIGEDLQEGFRADDRRKVCMLLARLIMIALGRELKSLRLVMKEIEREGPQT